MKNIRFYKAEKYNTDEYTEVEPNIYKTVSSADNGAFALEEVKDNELAEELKNSDSWAEGTTGPERFFNIIVYNGKKYYREKDNDDAPVMKKRTFEEKISYVTSIVFEQEPEYGENEPDDEISEYPLEDLLDKFFCTIGDDYAEENENDSVNSYIEFMDENIDDIRDIISIVGKHVYNKDNGEYVDLIIE